tara:strand:+ start:796 stop:1011 length:216 start_codon:yes stop_codon:yes gene_type:complete
MNRHHPNRKHRLRREYMPPYVVLEEEKRVIFFMESGMGYLAIPAFMKKFPEGYRGLRCRDKETFRKYGGKI